MNQRPRSGPSSVRARGTPRRQFLRAGLVGGLGLTLGDWLHLRASAATSAADRTGGSAGAVIHVFLPGGLAHQDSFDPKPYAPVQYRGPFRSIGTRIPGERFSELWKQTAKVADRLTVIRSMHHGEAAHERGTHNMFTGYRPSPALTYPSLGSVVSLELGPKNSLPPYVCIPRQPNEHAGSGYLSSAYSPFSCGDDPAGKNFKVRDLSLPKGVDEPRFARRRQLLDAVDQHFRGLEESDALDAMDSFYQRAYAMVSSTEAREAFRIEAEPDKLRDEYGRHAPGQRMLLARRLVEAGVRFVSLTCGSFDHHDNIKDQLRRQAPPVDQAFAALIRDLDRRGLLDRTLVLLTTEFGRTPRINNTEGRDHWPRVFSVLAAGAAVRRGFVYGQSSAYADEVEADGVGVEDLAKTMYHLLGIDASRELMAPGPRPIEIVKGGRVLSELLT